MKIIIVSDIHANLAALEALPEVSYDELWCLGDLVNYGPRPHEVLEWIEDHSTAVVRGNHDHAVGFNTDPQCSRAYKHLAAETMRYTQKVCTEDDVAFLRRLPTQRDLVLKGAKFHLVHATPANPLFEYRTKDSELWKKEAQRIGADFLFVGHTHKPFVRKVGKCRVVNPGSLGQPKTGRPFACYAIWQDGEISLKQYEYPLVETSRQIREMPLIKSDSEKLVAILETGGLSIPDKHSALPRDV